MKNVMDLRDKMGKTHKLQLMGMLRTKHLPDDVVRAYYAYKSITDPIDGLLVTADLVRILEGAGAIVIDWPVKPKMDSVVALIAKPSDTANETVDLSKKNSQEKELSDIESELSKEELVPWPDGAVAKGTMVTVFYEGRPEKVGVIDAVGEGYELTYTVNLNGKEKQFLAIDVMVD